MSVYGNIVRESDELNYMFNLVCAESNVFNFDFDTTIAIEEAVDVKKIKDGLIKLIKSFIEKITDFVKFLKTKARGMIDKIRDKIQQTQAEHKNESLKSSLKEYKENKNKPLKESESVTWETKTRIKMPISDMINGMNKYVTKYLDDLYLDNFDQKDAADGQELHFDSGKIKNFKEWMKENYGPYLVNKGEGITYMEFVDDGYIDHLNEYHKVVYKDLNEVTKQCEDIIATINDQLNVITKMKVEMGDQFAPGGVITIKEKEASAKYAISFYTAKMKAINDVIDAGIEYYLAMAVVYRQAFQLIGK